MVGRAAVLAPLFHPGDCAFPIHEPAPCAPVRAIRPGRRLVYVSRIGSRWRVRVFNPTLGRAVHVGLYPSEEEAQRAGELAWKRIEEGRAR